MKDFEIKNLSSALFRLPTATRICVIIVTCLLLPMTTVAQGLGPSEIRLIDGSNLTGTIETVDGEGIVSGADIKAGLNIQDILSIKTARKSTATKTAASVYLAGGGKLLVHSVLVADEAIKIRLFEEMEIPLQAIRAIEWSGSDIVAKAIATPSKDNDQVIVQIPDGEQVSERVVDGILEAVDQEFVYLNYKNETRKIGMPKIKAVVIADLGLKKPKGGEATVNLTNGSNLTGVIKQIADNQMDLAIAGGATIKLKLSEIASVSITSDRLRYLSDMEPSEVQEKSIFAIQLAWQKDRSVEKNPLRMRFANASQTNKYQTIEFKKGIGVQSFSQLSFDNTNEFDRFNAIAGIDVETQGRGDCRMVVRGDGIELWVKRVTGNSEPEEIDIDITGIKTVELIVYPGADFDLSDHADWANARFVKTK